ncbi:hypothetical protein BV20DRAFT_923747, partial [Pilatotrama ljubarskyi]
LYGRPQGGHTWNCTMHAHLFSVGFTCIDSKYCLYYCTTDEGTIITGVYVNDFITI